MNHTNDVELIENAGWDERILVCRNGELVDTTIVVSRRYVIIVDTMINPATAEALLQLARPYLGAERSLLVVNTHADYDHCWGNQAFAARAVPIIGRHASVPIFSQPGTISFLEQMQEEEPEIFAAVRPTAPTVLFDETLVIDGGDLTLELFATPGHTVDHLSICIPQCRTLLAADAAEFPFPMARTPEGLPALRSSLSRLAALEAQTVLYCHAPVDMGAALIEENIAYFDRLEEACRRALDAGLPHDLPPTADAARRVELSYAQAVPDTAIWQNVHDFHRTGGHAQQLRHMLACLGSD